MWRKTKQSSSAKICKAQEALNQIQWQMKGGHSSQAKLLSERVARDELTKLLLMEESMAK